ncbi:MAG: hypothetical protein ACP5UI_02475 [Thermoprotei archaeon]|nr:hypothetical protein [TACK group archaeon]
MRKNILITGLILMLVGVSLLVGGPVVFKSGLNSASLTSAKNTASLQRDQALLVASLPSGRGLVVYYNDTAKEPLNVTATSGTVASQSVNGSYLAEVLNTGSSSSSVYIEDNLSVPAEVTYSLASFSISSVMYSVGSVLAGFLLALAGGVISVAGLILRKKGAGKAAVPPSVGQQERAGSGGGRQVFPKTEEKA